MSSQSAPRHSQGDELIAAINRNTIAAVALTTALGAVLVALNRNNELMQEIEDDEDEEDACADCGDEDCDGDCQPPRRKR